MRFARPPTLTLPRKGRAIAFGNFGFQSFTEGLLRIPKLRLGHALDSIHAGKDKTAAICDCPALTGEGRGGGDRAHAAAGIAGIFTGRVETGRHSSWSEGP